jgi:HEAT repeat protein
VRSGFLGLAAALLVSIAARTSAQDSSAALTAEPSYEGRVLSGWVAQLTDRVPTARSRAAQALAGLGPAAAPAVPALRRTLADDDPLVRYAAIWALSEIGPAARVAIPELERLAAQDRVGDVRWIAAKALRKLGVRDARPAASRPPRS